MEIQVDIEAKPSHYQLASGSSTEDSLHVHTQMAENEEEEEEEGEEEEEEEDGEQEQTCKHQSCEQKDCVASKTWDITLAQPESIRSDLESSDSQSDDVPDLTSDECASPRSHSAAPCPQTPSARGAESPSAPLSHCAHAEGCRLDEMVTLECIEARVWGALLPASTLLSLRLPGQGCVCGFSLQPHLASGSCCFLHDKKKQKQKECPPPSFCFNLLVQAL